MGGDKSGEPGSTEYGNATQSETQSHSIDKKRELIDDILHIDSDNDDDAATGLSVDKKSSRPTFSRPEEYLLYTFHIPRSRDQTVRLSSKLYYVFDEAFAELSPRNIATVDFWIAFIVLVMAVWIRGFMHAFGSWLMLQMMGVSVNKFATMV